tara:strand:- start:808 stop:2253 length:1446 start_codon:yes stop_codon:yes gene_type:complete
MATSPTEREYFPLPDPEPPKWWQLREQLRGKLRESEVPDYRIDQLIGKNPEQFQRMNELRREVALPQVTGVSAIPHSLGSLDAALGITSVPAFTKTMGQMALPYAAMGLESATGFTDILKAIKEEPEDQPKDFGYYARRVGLPLSGLAGAMAINRFTPGKNIANKLPEEIANVDKTRRNILKTGAIAGALSTIPRPLTSTIKYGSKAPISAAATKNYANMFGPNLTNSSIGNRITGAFTGGGGDMAVAPISRKRFLDDDFNLISVEDSVKTMRKRPDGSKRVRDQADLDNHVKEITKALDDASVTGDLKAISQSGKDHFKNYNLGPEEIQIIDYESFNRPGRPKYSHIARRYDLMFGDYIPIEDVRGWKGSEKVIAEGENLRQLPRTSSDFDYWEELNKYIRTNGTKMGEAKPLTDAEKSNPGGDIYDMEYYELDGIPVALGMWSNYDAMVPVIITPNTKGMDTLTGATIDRLAEIELEGM